MEEYRYPSYDFNASTTPSTPNMSIRHRRPPDVPEDAVSEHDFLLEHLNDPNYDLNSPQGHTPPPTYSGGWSSIAGKESIELDRKKLLYNNYDSENGYDRPESRNSGALDFDESVSNALRMPVLRLTCPVFL